MRARGIRLIAIVPMDELHDVGAQAKRLYSYVRSHDLFLVDAAASAAAAAGADANADTDVPCHPFLSPRDPEKKIALAFSRRVAAKPPGQSAGDISPPVPVRRVRGGRRLQLHEPIAVPCPAPAPRRSGQHLQCATALQKFWEFFYFGSIFAVSLRTRCVFFFSGTRCRKTTAVVFRGHALPHVRTRQEFEPGPKREISSTEILLVKWRCYTMVGVWTHATNVLR